MNWIPMSISATSGTTISWPIFPTRKVSKVVDLYSVSYRVPLLPRSTRKKVQVYELGFKLEGLDQRLRMTGAVFFNDYTDLQIVVERGGIAPVTENAGKAEIWGGELELSWLPIAGQDLRLTGGLGWLDAEYETLDPTQTTVTLDHEIPSTPDLQYNLSVSYTLPNSIFSGNLNFRLDYSWTDEYFMTAGNQVIQMQDSYGILNRGDYLDQ